jgi:hypothetical protein
MTSEEQSSLIERALGGAPGISSPHLTAYMSFRRRMRARVLAGLAESDVSPLGSWRTGQFHLATTGTASLGDVDAWTSGLDHHRESTLVVPGSGGGPLTLRLSIHPYNYESTMSLRAQKVLALLNLSASHGRGRQARRYQVHKALLTLSRGHRSETYAETAERLGQLGLHALATKIGLDAEPSPVLDRSVLLRLADEVVAFTGLPAPAWSSRLGEVAGRLLDDPALAIDPAFRRYLRSKFRTGKPSDG